MKGDRANTNTSLTATGRYISKIFFGNVVSQQSIQVSHDSPKSSMDVVSRSAVLKLVCVVLIGGLLSHICGEGLNVVSFCVGYGYVLQYPKFHSAAQQHPTQYPNNTPTRF
eukprot:1343807-Amorphochlora_amoeboformis.AAC.1